MKKIEILLIIMVLCFVFVSCSKVEDNRVEEEIIEEEISVSSESEVSKESEESIPEEITDLEGEFKSLSYIIKSNWKVTSREDLQIISLDDESMVIALYTTLEEEKEKVKDFTIEDIEATLLSMTKSMENTEGTKVISEPIINKTDIAGMEAVSLEREMEFQGVESKIIVYVLKDEDTLYYINYNSMLKDIEENLPMFNEFLGSIEKK